VIGIVLGLCLSLAGVFAAFVSWRAKSRPMLALAVLFWALATGAWIAGFGAEIGLPLAVETSAVVAFAFILTRVERRRQRERRGRIVPPPPPERGRRLRGLIRSLVAGPLGLVAAMGLGVAVAIAAPMVEQTRLILAGLIVPSLWAGFIVWTLASARPAMTGLWLGIAGAAGYAVAFLPRG
jgi:hypothetical protein